MGDTWEGSPLQDLCPTALVGQTLCVTGAAGWCPEAQKGNTPTAAECTSKSIGGGGNSYREAERNGTERKGRDKGDLNNPIESNEHINHWTHS
ncbi:hypothetical protein WR25_18727 [Diploscapter pachys]|uniref:Uncharacterized protein n=1 Tax=Diploscapter pachys TaxID=2018661 RepID=A0A2A2K3Y7_9BILA|nr:hypothetical protein WR25_18727 [Diploscapter pachys]